MEHSNQYQYDDMLIRQVDPYANAKYGLIVSSLTGKTPLRILNAGCGSGELSFLLAEAGHTVVGIDPGLEYIQLARKSLPRHLALRCSFEVASIEEAQFSRSFDAVIATDVLEHINDDRTAAYKLAQLVLPGGLLVVTVPALPWLFGFHDEQLGHWRRYGAGALKKLVCGTGMIAIEKMRYFGWTLIPVCILFSTILRRHYPVATVGHPQKTFIGTMLHVLLRLDTKTALPFGTSLILFGRKR